MRKEKDIKKLNSLNEFERLVENLLTGELGILHMGLAYSEFIRRRTDIPEGVKNLLVKVGDSRGLSSHLWRPIAKTVGNMELAFRRGCSPE